MPEKAPNSTQFKQGLHFVRQTFILTKAMRWNFFGALKRMGHFAEHLLPRLKEPKRSLDDIINSGIHIKEYDPEVRNRLGNQILMQLIPNIDTTIISTESIDNIRIALKLIKQGNKVAFCANHISELDPAVFLTKLSQIDFNTPDPTTDYNQIAEKIYVVIGSIVRESPFKDYFAGLVNRLYVFSKKHFQNEERSEQVKMGNFNRDSITQFRELMKKDPEVSLFVHPGGKRSRPLVDGKYIEENWDPKESAHLFKSLDINTIIPISIKGTENIHAPTDYTSEDPSLLLRNGEVFIQVGPPIILTGWENDKKQHNLDLIREQITEGLETMGSYSHIRNGINKYRPRKT